MTDETTPAAETSTATPTETSTAASAESAPDTDALSALLVAEDERELADEQVTRAKAAHAAAQERVASVEAELTSVQAKLMSTDPANVVAFDGLVDAKASAMARLDALRSRAAKAKELADSMLVAASKASHEEEKAHLAILAEEIPAEDDRLLEEFNAFEEKFGDAVAALQKKIAEANRLELSVARFTNPKAGAIAVGQEHRRTVFGRSSLPLLPASHQAPESLVALAHAILRERRAEARRAEMRLLSNAPVKSEAEKRWAYLDRVGQPVGSGPAVPPSTKALTEDNPGK